MSGQESAALARLDGRAVVVLGAGGGGIGNATCRTLAAAGAKLFCVDLDPAQAESSAAECGGTAHAADVTDRAQMEALFARATELYGTSLYGIVDVVGRSRVAPLAAMDDDALTQQFDLVLRHALLAVQIGAPLLAKNGGGCMTLIGSAAGSRAIENISAYGIAKSAVHHLVRCAALEYGPAGVRVNGIAPSYVATPRVAGALPQQVWDAVTAANPLRRIATPQDVANAVLLLSCDLAAYITGNIVMLDGGVTNVVPAPGLEALPVLRSTTN
ncbi:SDR family oxidoreductase [Sphingomonas sp. AOB5]|uniref:SDR family NAD(P)-dependent oxidoreductase n=1 Tax=Sphingomonas sp. AOB5 TaxID=3034017 RepID=UPI0023F855A2|nr:SDR family oxidoreductase [Sphingomonas sp. AOB5]MDF7774861.1 SDR family oxidoreductase [Sphingomonas sp. AOB5]